MIPTATEILQWPGIAVFCALRFQNDFPGALCAAVNVSGDSDSTGCVMGAVLGAACGLDAIPKDWIETVENGDLLLQLADDLRGIASLSTNLRPRPQKHPPGDSSLAAMLPRMTTAMQ